MLFYYAAYILKTVQCYMVKTSRFQTVKSSFTIQQQLVDATASFII